jgi:hypothetical protein
MVGKGLVGLTRDWWRPFGNRVGNREGEGRRPEVMKREKFGSNVRRTVSNLSQDQQDVRREREKREQGKPS